MFHVIFSVENDFSIVMEKVRICGNEDAGLVPHPQGITQ